jgi:hypothetical protein
MKIDRQAPNPLLADRIRQFRRTRYGSGKSGDSLETDRQLPGN